MKRTQIFLGYYLRWPHISLMKYIRRSNYPHEQHETRLLYDIIRIFGD